MHGVRSSSLVLLALASACHTHTHEEHLKVEEPVVSLEVNVGSGDLDIVGADVDEVSVNAKIVGASNHLGHGLDEGRLTLFDDCNELLCGVDITVFVPAAVPISLRTGSGDVQARGTHAEISIRTGSGDIDARDVLGIALRAETGSGDVALGVRAPAEHVVVRTAAGDVDLVLPGGGYRLDVSTGAGDEHVDGVHDDAAAPGLVEVNTGFGDVQIRGR